MKNLLLAILLALQIFHSSAQNPSPRFMLGLNAGPVNTYFLGQPTYFYEKIQDNLEKREVPSPGYRIELTASTRLKGKHYFQTGFGYRQNKHWLRLKSCGFASCFDESIDINSSYLTIFAGHYYSIFTGKQINVLIFNGMQTEFSIDYYPSSVNRPLAFSYLTKLTAEYYLSGKYTLSISPLFSMALSRYSSGEAEVVSWPYTVGVVIGLSYRI